MRLSRKVYDDRLNHIIRSFIHLTHKMGVKPADVPVVYLVKIYGFTNNFTKTDALRKALLSMLDWKARYLFHNNVSPSKAELLSYVRKKMGIWEESWKKSSAMPKAHLQRMSSLFLMSWITSKSVLSAFLPTRCMIRIPMSLFGKDKIVT